MMSKEANVRAILECNFTGFKDEIIDTAVKLICDLECEPITSPSQHWAKQAENFGEIAMNEIDKARFCKDCVSRESVLMELGKYLCGVPFDEKGIDEVIKELPSVIPQPQRWIPVTEKLPEEAGVYLVSMNHLGYPQRDIDGFVHGKWERYGSAVIAWCKIPEPYKEDKG